MVRISERHKIYIALTILFVICWGVFGNSLGNGFVWDDSIYIINNQIYKNFEVTRIITSLANELEYLPVRDLSYALDYLVGQGKPFTFHFSNVLIYSLIVCSVFFYARAVYKIIGKKSIFDDESVSTTVGFLTALMFSVHPIHAEAVNFITCRNALLSTLFFFISSIIVSTAFSSENTLRKCSLYLFGLLAFVLSIFSKANSIILPFIVCLESLYQTKGRTPKRFAVVLPFFLVAVGSFYLLTSIAAKATIISDKLEDWTFNSCVTKIVKALQIPVFYLGKLLYPNNLSASYDVVFAWSPFTPIVIVIFVCFIAVFVSAFILRKKFPYLLFSLCWFLLSLIPVLNFFVTTPVVSDRYVLLPSFAFFFLLACIFAQLAAKLRPIYIIFVCAVIVSYWGTLTVQQNRVWYSDETLWRDNIRTSPKDPKGYRNLGNYYLLNGDYQKAVKLFEPIKDADPSYYFALGLLAYNAGDMQLSKEHFTKSIARDVKFIGSIYYLGQVYERTGQVDLAIELFKQTIRLPNTDGGFFRNQAAERLRQLSVGPKL